MLLLSKSNVLLTLAVVVNCISFIYGEINTCEAFLDYVQTARFNYNSKKTYVSKISCVICSKPDCDFSSGRCSKKSSTPSIPLYNNMLEFGLAGNYIPLITLAVVEINNECNITTEIIHRIDSGNILIRLFECSFNNCEPYDYELELKLTDKDRCLQAGLMFLEERKIYFSLSTTCQKVSTAFFDSKKYVEIKRNECKFSEVNEMEVKFSFLQDDTRKIDGVPLALPCNGGGYSVDPNRGTFWNKVECWDYLTSSDFPTNNTGLDFVVSKKYDGHEDYRFPIANDDWTLDDVFPPYFDKNGMPLPREMVRSFRDQTKKTDGLERYGCALVKAKEMNEL